MRKIEDYAVFFIVGGLLVFSLSLSIINATVIPVAFGTLAMVTGLFLLAFAIIFYNRYTFLIILSLLIIASISLLFGWEKYFKDKEYIIEFILEFQKIIQFVRGYLPYTEELGLYVVLAIVGFLSLYMTLALYVTFQFGLTCALGFGLFGLNWIMNYERSDFAFLIFIFCFCVLLFKKLNARKSTGNLQALFIMPLCLAALYGAYRMPGFDTDWDTQQVIRFVRNPMDSTNDFLYFLFNPKYFSFRLTGYVDGKSRLGGSIGLSNEVVMEVIADKRTYLSGLVHNTYTGVEWINTIGEDFSANYNIDEASREAKETEYSLPIFSIGNNVYNDVPKERLTINPNMRRTATIFRPLKNYGVEHTSDLKVMTNTLGDVRFSDVLPVGGGYSFEYLDVDYENEIIKTLLRQSRRGLYKGVSQTLASYADYVYGNFVEIPEIVPQRVKDLALEITADYGNDYDRAQSIKDYLIEIPYTLTPGAVEDGFDFVDYFLFENRQGYCTYYASAMAILCRAIGLPTRYLEGYIMPAGQSRPRVYQITDMQAHAWVEVYFEGFGWVPFEPTAPYSVGMSDDNSTPNSSMFTPEFAADPYNEQYIEDMLGDKAGLFIPTGPAASMPVETNTDESENKRVINPVIMFAVLVMVGYLSIAFCSGAMKIFLRNRRIKKMSRKDQVVALFQEIIKMAAYLRYPLYGTETPLNYARRVGKRFAFKNERIFMGDLVLIYNKANFGNSAIKSNELKLLKDCRAELMANIKNSRYKIQFIWDRYIVRKI